MCFRPGIIQFWLESIINVGVCVGGETVGSAVAVFSGVAVAVDVAVMVGVIVGVTV